jgi:hypothetical protein
MYRLDCAFIVPVEQGGNCLACLYLPGKGGRKVETDRRVCRPCPRGTRPLRPWGCSLMPRVVWSVGAGLELLSQLGR